jgi:hypothetical protein
VRRLPILAFALLASHGVVLYFATSRLSLPATIVSGVLLALMVRHLDLVGVLVRLFSRRRGDG